MNRRAAVVALAAVLAVGACSPAPSPSSPRETIAIRPSGSGGPVPSGAFVPPVVAQMPPCQLVTRDEAATALGVEIMGLEPIEDAVADRSSWLGECLFFTDEEFVPLTLGLGIGPTYLDRFNTLRSAPDVRPTSGLGDEGFVRMSTIAGLDGPVGAQYVRTRDAVIAVSLGIVGVRGDGGLELVGDAAAQERVLGMLGATALARLTGTEPDPIATPTPAPFGSVTPLPIDPAALEHPCSLLSDAEVGTITAMDIAEHLEWSEDSSGQDARCRYLAESGWAPLQVRIAHGPDAVTEFRGLLGPGAREVSGVGDRALRQEVAEPYAEPTVTLHVLKGDALVELELGLIGEDPNFGGLALGTVEEQERMARQLAELLLTRLNGGT
jgi:hypothetical protein